MSQKKTLLKKLTSTKNTRKKQKNIVNKNVNTIHRSREPLVLQSLRGMRDILPGEQAYWNQVRQVLQKSVQEYGFERIDIPVLEYANLFERAIGEGTDIIDSELYTFTNQNNERVALRPEFTTGIVRAYIQHGMNILHKPIRLFSTGSVYRNDRIEDGRYREHVQANFDFLGEIDPILDAQVIQLAYRILKSLGLKNIQFHVNNVGTPESQNEYKKILIRYFDSKKQKLPQKYHYLIRINPFHIFDLKDDKCMQICSLAPQSIDHLDVDSHAHFKTLLEYLDELQIPYIINPRLVRGLNYYTRTVFEIISNNEQELSYSLGGGGRYDQLIQNMGGEPTPAIGFAFGLDRLVLEMKRVKARTYHEQRPKVFLAQLGALAKKKSLQLFSDLEKNGILVSESFGRGTLKSQLRIAERRGVLVTLIIGQKEALDNTIILKNMDSGTQETVTREKLVSLVKKIIKN